MKNRCILLACFVLLLAAPAQAKPNPGDPCTEKLFGVTQVSAEGRDIIACLKTTTPNVYKWKSGQSAETGSCVYNSNTYDNGQVIDYIEKAVSTGTYAVTRFTYKQCLNGSVKTYWFEHTDTHNNSH